MFEPYNRAKRVNFIFPSLTLDDSHLNAVSSFKYLGHIVSALTSDNDILHQMSLLYARANMLIRKFGKCSRYIKIRLFRTYCTNFYGAALWKQYNATTIKKAGSSIYEAYKNVFCL